MPTHDHTILQYVQIYTIIIYYYYRVTLLLFHQDFL